MDTAEPEPPPVQASFGTLLRQYRLAAGLTQAALAERAGLSGQGLSALESGKRQAPYRHTVTLLARALGLSAAETALLEAAVVRVRVPAGDVPPPAPEHPATTAAESTPATALPTGTLTFLLTDIEGSTSFWEQHPAAMQAAIVRHDALMDAVLARHGGRQVKERGEGDSILAVFTSPSAALAAVCALQVALLAESWPPETPLRVRMGLHTGEAELRGIGYYGVTVNRTARIRSLAHGGQILLSQATADLVRGLLRAGTSLRALGAHRLKGLAEPEEVYQVLHPGLPADFPPLASPSAHPSNLPAALTSFVGREQEQAEVRALLDAARLVTLTGAGGAGKTRLALAVAETVLGEYPDGIWLVELAPLADPAPVVGAVAQALGLREEPGRPLLATLLAHLKERRLLLVLDNCEHLVAACAEVVTAVLRGCPPLRLLATSRESLGVAGERLYRVPSLAVPDPAHLPTPEQLAGYAAVALFLTRAQERRSDFALTAQNARTVASICARLDGLPLAIELAAARVGSLPVEAIAARLDDRFKLLSAGPRTALPRQQTLRAALDWSYDLLSEGEQRLLDRLSVFAGGCTLEAVEAVCPGPGVEAWEVLDLLGSLVNKSLVLLDETGPDEEQGRYRLLETVREFGQERLVASAEAASVQQLHGQYYLTLAEAAELQLRGAQQMAWLERLEAEHHNLRAALRWALDRGEVAMALRLGGSLWRFWQVRGYLREGGRWLEDALATPAAKNMSAIRAKALAGAGVLAHYLGDYNRSASLCGESLALCRQLGDTAGIAQALHGLALVARSGGEYGTARAMYAEAVALLRAVGDRSGLAYALDYQATVLWMSGDWTAARPPLEEARALFTELGDGFGTADVLTVQAVVAHAQGDDAMAHVLGEEALDLSRRLEGRHMTIRVLFGLAQAACGLGEYAVARRRCEECFTLATELGDRFFVATALEALAGVVAACGQAAAAARLFGAAERLRETIGAPMPPAFRVDYQASLARARAQLDAAAFAAAWAAGRLLTPDQAMAGLVQANQTTGATRVQVPAPLGPPALPSSAMLTPREAEVLRLVATGRTDTQIAEQLSISTRTVHAHVRSIYGKLDVTNRSAATRYALDHGLA